LDSEYNKINQNKG